MNEQAIEIGTVNANDDSGRVELRWDPESGQIEAVTPEGKIERTEHRAGTLRAAVETARALWGKARARAFPVSFGGSSRRVRAWCSSSHRRSIFCREGLTMNENEDGFETIGPGDPEPKTELEKTREKLQGIVDGIGKAYPLPWQMSPGGGTARTITAANGSVVAVAGSEAVGAYLILAANTVPILLAEIEKNERIAKGLVVCEICGATVDPADEEAHKGWGHDEEDGCDFCPSCMTELDQVEDVLGTEPDDRIGHAPTLPCDAPPEPDGETVDETIAGSLDGHVREATGNVLADLATCVDGEGAKP